MVEGEVTEPEYFSFVRRSLRDSLLVIEVSREKGEPLRLVEAAVREKERADREARRRQDENLRFDEVWCVVDVDEHERLPDALLLAERSDISVAVSNPCFELWILLHFADQHGFLTAHEASRRLRSHIDGYEKHLDCTVLAGKYSTALARARSLAEMHERNGSVSGSNPSTGVWRLIEALLTAAARSRGGLGSELL